MALVSVWDIKEVNSQGRVPFHGRERRCGWGGQCPLTAAIYPELMVSILFLFPHLPSSSIFYLNDS